MKDSPLFFTVNVNKRQKKKKKQTQNCIMVRNPVGIYTLVYTLAFAKVFAINHSV